MTRIFGIALICSLFGFQAMSQIPEDAIRYSWYPNNATARIMAVGGCMGSLGGDIYATFVNPAGLALYRNREAVFSLNWNENTSNAAYRDSSSRAFNNLMPIGPMGVLGSYGGRQSKENIVFSLAFNQLASFNDKVQYSGYNNYSSFSEQFAEEFAYSGYTIDEVKLTNPSPLPYGSAPALAT